jgi:hypothetical protein
MVIPDLGNTEQNVPWNIGEFNTLRISTLSSRERKIQKATVAVAFSFGQLLRKN